MVDTAHKPGHSLSSGTSTRNLVSLILRSKLDWRRRSIPVDCAILFPSTVNSPTLQSKIHHCINMWEWNYKAIIRQHFVDMAAEQSHMSPSVKGGGQRGRESHGELPLRLRVQKGEGGEGGRGRGREREGGKGRGSEGEEGRESLNWCQLHQYVCNTDCYNNQ